MIFINLVGLIHHPEYSFPFNIQLAKEHSAIGIKLLRPQDESLHITSQNGIDVTITGQPENSTVPHSNLALNGTHHITFRIINGGDIPSHIFSNGGPNSVNLRFGLPQTDGLASSICCRPDTAVKWIEQHQKYEIWTIMEAFLIGQREEYAQQKEKISGNADFTFEERDKQLKALRKKLFRTQVNDFAAENHTCICSHQPFFWTENE